MPAKSTAILLAASLTLGGCANQAGGIDWLRTAGAGVAILAIGGLVYAAAKDGDKNSGYERRIDECRRRESGHRLRDCIDRARR